ncbi:hypothetical protein BKA56DRAFT_673753 [Ilyonectria sp. MPI-CAGE-AT-0026]|nr:hypothetical protein BKA56DRAFT_673753 [Ilyonectria sp. MPI-CAGE-AT-0026]
MASQTPWGSNSQDFRVREGKKGSATRAAASSQKRKRTTPKTLPTLARELDELHNLVEIVVAEEEIKNPDTSFFTEDPRQDTDDDLGEQDLETFSDFDDVDSEVSDSESVNDNGDDGTLGCLQMCPEVIDTLIAEVERAHNCETEEHDFEFLLHPLVRSYRCRNAVGQQPTSQQDTLSGLEYFPLSENLAAVPNVVGTYLLHGIRAFCQDSAKDPRYVGQAASMSITDSGAVGIRLRGGQHCTSVKTCKCGLKSAKRPLRVHNRLAKSDITGIEIAVLSLFPFPVPQLGEDTLLHFLSILTLAETIDVILLDTLSPLKDYEYRLRVGSKEGLAALKPGNVPRRLHEGLNRAIPLIQGSSRLKGVPYSTSWSPSEVAVFIQTVEEYENDVYVHGVKGTTCVQYDFLVSRLRLSGLHKTRAEVVTLYRALAQNPNSDFISRQSSRWRSVWTEVYGVKQHLEKLDLVAPPVGSNDLFYHVPRLENGHKTSYHFRELLRTTGYANYKHPLVRTKFWTVYLPRLLHRDVWEKITEKPPKRLAAKLANLPKNIYHRSLAVVLHFARLHALEHYHSTLTSDFARVPTFKWSDLVQIWHYASAQLVADGVPRHLVFPGGAMRIMVLLVSHGNKIVDPYHSEPLPQWTYTQSSQDSQEDSQTETLSGSPHSRDSSNSPSNGVLEIQSSQEIPLDEYEWPSEASRYETVAASHELLALTAPNEATQTLNVIKVGVTHVSPCEMAQYRTSTLRVLIRLMRHHHESQYDSIASSYSGDRSFWSVLFIDLDRSWNLTGSAQLEHRFSWVLELIRTGSLPAQAHVASEILQKRLSGSVFLKEMHPYNYKVRCSTRKFLNPDLSPEWTKAFLKANDALPAVEKDMQKRMDGCNIEGFCSMYGILITQLWEQAMTEQGHFYPGLALVRPRAATPASRQVSEASAAQEVQGRVQPATDKSDNPPPPSPPPYPPLKGHSTTRRSTLWEHQEVDYLKYLMELSIPQKEMLAKFHGRFGEYRTLQSLHTRIKLLRRAARARAEQDTLPIETTARTLQDDPVQPKSLTSPQPMQQEPSLRQASLEPDTPKVSRHRDTTSRKQSAARKYLEDQSDAKRKLLRSLIQTCDNWNQVTSAMKARFGTKGSMQVFQTIASLEKMNASRVSARNHIRWNAQDHAILESLLQRCTSWKEVYDKLEAESPRSRNMQSIRHYATTHKMDVSKVAGSSRWTLQEDNVLRELFDSGVPRSEYPTRFLEAIGPGRTHGAIIERTQRLGLLAKKFWSDAELQNVRDHRHLKLKEFSDQFWGKFGHDRTYNTLKEQRRKQNSAHQDD